MKGLIITLLLFSFVLTACEPSDSRPGLWLSGEVEAFPSDWSFSDDFELIAVQVDTPYGLPHSVTIWCVQVDGNLYIAARAPESKNWPGWVEKNPDIKLKFGDRVFEGRLQKLEDPDAIGPISTAYSIKYHLTQDLNNDDEGPRSWFWQVLDRQG
ncbi:MAG: hypothetical protein CMQ15_00865 [Gammaproteobacteria bacterium]|jgi:hypothetical protein|nr:hypothetical protein [Gammaproteobacteria bacterium]|tara:strand:+ start:579 stop:1043 length:465 start_codon:yes stop_codon:yes gene_type:complete